MKFAWTDAVVARLKELRQGGWSASEIAAKLDCPSRNSVIGKLHRMGLPCPNIRRAQADGPRKQKLTRPSSPRIPRRVKAEAAAIPSVAPLPPISYEDCIELEHLEPSHCRWPVEKDGQSMRYCGRKTCDRSSGVYCSGHAEIAYDGKVSRTKRKGGFSLLRMPGAPI